MFGIQPVFKQQLGAGPMHLISHAYVYAAEAIKQIC